MKRKSRIWQNFSLATSPGKLKEEINCAIFIGKDTDPLSVGHLNLHV